MVPMESRRSEITLAEANEKETLIKTASQRRSSITGLPGTAGTVTPVAGASLYRAHRLAGDLAPEIGM